ncbi:MAG: DUF6531 domain-containing protein [Synergistaceae bacterium]|nr:DUF6531 domain-containing protein [Synergistaceae bacterium]
MDFQLSIPILERVVKFLNKAITDMNSLKKESSQAVGNLTTNGWKGESSEVFSEKSRQWEDDFSIYIDNLLLVRDTLKKVLDLSENLNRQALSFAGLFGGNTSGAKNLLSLSRQAKAAVCRNCQKAIDEYDRYRSDLQKLKQLNNSFRYSKLSILNEINSSSREIEGCQSNLRKLIKAINEYEEGVDELERTMKQWESEFVRSKRWPEFGGQLLAMLGEIGLKGIAALAKVNPIGAFVASLFGVSNSCCLFGGDPVNLATGNFVYQNEFLKTKGLFPMSFVAFYNALEQRGNSLGFGWVHNFEVSISIKDSQATVFHEDGKQEIFIRSDRGQYYQSQGVDNHLRVKDGALEYQTHAGLKYTFDSFGKLLRKEDRNANFIEMTYDEKGILTYARNNSGATFEFRYEECAENEECAECAECADNTECAENKENGENNGNAGYTGNDRNKENGKLLQVCDNTGRTVSFEYMEDVLICISDENGGKHRYGYNKDNKLIKITNPLGTDVLSNDYDDRHRVSRQVFPDGGVIDYQYKDDENKLIMTQQNGNEIVYIHDERYRSVGTVYEDGSERYEYNDQNLRELFIDKNGNETKYSYDDRGNPIKVRNPLGEMVETEYNRFNKPVRIKLCGEEKVRMNYDSKGNAIEIIDAIDRTTKTEYAENGLPIKIIQPDGSEVNLEYDNKGNIITISEPQTTKRYEYDEVNRVSATIDGNGNRTCFEYNDKNDIVKVINANGDERSYEYNANGKVTKIRDFDGSVLIWEYNCLGKPGKIIDQEGNETGFEYDSMWNVSKRTDANGNATTLEYDNLNRLKRVINAKGHEVKYGYDPNGNRTSITGLRGEQTNIAYDPLNRISELTEPDGAKTSVTYNNMGKITDVTNPLGHKSVFAYDKVGRKIRETDPSGRVLVYSYTPLDRLSEIVDSAGIKTRLEYLPGGLLKKIIYPDGRSTGYAFDANGNIISQTSQDGYSLNYEYDCLDRVICIRSNKNQVKKYAYDAVGNVTSVTDANNNTTKYTYSPTGRLVTVTDPLGNKNEYDYDRVGDLIEARQLDELNEAKKMNEQNSRLHVTKYKRDELGQVEKIIDAVGNAEAYNYDEAGNVLSKLDKDNFLTKYGYGVTNHLEEVVYADGKSVKLSYNPLKQLTEIKDWLGVTVVEADEIGRTKKVTDHNGREVSYTIGSSGERTSMEYPDGKVVEYKYDEALRLNKLFDGNRQIDYVYDENSRLSEKVFSNGVRTRYAYNDMGLISELTHSDKDGVLDRYSYSYDNMINKVGIQKYRRGMEDESGEFKYTYDALSRLTGVIKDDKQIKEFSYDGFGNRDYVADRDVRTEYAYNSLNQLTRLKNNTRVQDFSYDARGNLTRITDNGIVKNTYEFGPINRLTKATNSVGQTADYEYNGLGFRVGKQITDSLNPTKNISYVLDLTKQYHNLLQLHDENGTQSFAWDDNVASSSDSAGDHIFLQDDLGSPLRYINGYGNLTESYAYDEFGSRAVSIEQKGDSAKQPFGFAGYQFDNIAQTYFAQAREYDPLIGRFTSVDAVGGFISDPVTMHPYMYCWNNPLCFIDPDGNYTRYEGVEAHNKLQDLVKSLYGDTASIEYAVQPYPYSPSGVGYADIIIWNDKSGAEVYEIKPISQKGKTELPYGSITGPVQRQAYIKALTDMGKRVNPIGVSFNPDKWTLPSNLNPRLSIRYYTFPNEPGMIYWGYVTDNTRRNSYAFSKKNENTGQNSKSNEKQEEEAQQPYVPDSWAAITPVDPKDVIIGAAAAILIAGLAIGLAGLTGGASLALLCI